MERDHAKFCQDAILEKFLGICHQNSYPERTNIIVPGDIANDLYYVVEGTLAISMPGTDKRDYILAYLNPGDFIGEMGMFVQPHGREVLIKTRTPCQLAKVSYTRLWDALENELRVYAVGFLKLIGEKLSMRLLKTNRKVLTLSSLDVEGRIARTLLELADEPTAIPHTLGKQVKITREELSRLVGCSRELAGKTLKSLEEQGMILTAGRTIVILDDNRYQQESVAAS